MKLDHHVIKEMMKMIQNYDLEEFSYEGEQGKIALKASSVEEISKTNLKEREKKDRKGVEEKGIDYVVSESIGRYYFIQENGARSIDIGKEIRAGESIGYVTSIGISTPLISKYSGVIEEILVGNGDIIDFGKKIIKIRKKTS